MHHLGDAYALSVVQWAAGALAMPSGAVVPFDPNATTEADAPAAPAPATGSGVAVEDGTVQCAKEAEDSDVPECLIWH